MEEAGRETRSCSTPEGENSGEEGRLTGGSPGSMRSG